MVDSYSLLESKWQTWAMPVHVVNRGTLQKKQKKTLSIMIATILVNW
jgi:hypothetical protein